MSDGEAFILAAARAPVEQLAVTQIEAARLMNVSDRTIRNWDESGIIKGTTIGGLKLYRIDDLRKLLER